MVFVGRFHSSRMAAPCLGRLLKQSWRLETLETLEVGDETIAGSNQESLAVSQPHIDVKTMSCDAIDKVRRLDSQEFTV